MHLKPLYQRPADLIIVLFYSLAAVYSLLFSLPEAMGVPVSADSPWIPLQYLYEWAVAEEPTHLMDPLPIFLFSATAIDGFLYGPFTCVLIYAFIFGKNWIRIWALLFAGSAMTNMYYYFMATLLGDHPPPNTFYYLVFNLPWLLVPMLLAWRMRLEKPFG